MHVLDLLSIGAAESDVAAARLIVARVGYRRALLILVHAGQPQLYVICGRHRRGAVARRQLAQVEVQTQTLDQRARLADELLEHGVRILGLGIAEHLDLVELMAADHAALAGAVGARLAAVAGRVRKQLARQHALVQYLAAIEVYERRLGGGQHEAEALLVQAVHVVLELGELTRGQAAFVGQHVRRQHELVAVLYVGADEVVEQRPFQLCAQTGVQPVAVAAHLNAALVVYKTQRGAQIHVVLALVGQVRLFAERVDHLIVLLAARDHVLGGQVGQSQHELLNLVLQLGLLFVQLLYAVGHGLELLQQRRGVLTLLAQRGYLLVELVALGLDALVFGQNGTALLVPLEQFGKVRVVAALGQTVLYIIRIAADKVKIQHVILLQSKWQS